MTRSSLPFLFFYSGNLSIKVILVSTISGISAIAGKFVRRNVPFNKFDVEDSTTNQLAPYI